MATHELHKKKQDRDNLQGHASNLETKQHWNRHNKSQIFVQPTTGNNTITKETYEDLETLALGKCTHKPKTHKHVTIQANANKIERLSIPPNGNSITIMFTTLIIMSPLNLPTYNTPFLAQQQDSINTQIALRASTRTYQCALASQHQPPSCGQHQRPISTILEQKKHNTQH